MNVIEATIYSIDDFPQFDSAYEGFATETENDLYFGLCTHDKHHSAGVFCFDKINREIRQINSIDNIRLQQGCLPHGKIHTKLFMGIDGNLYFGTHFAYPDCIPQEINYEGGHIVAFNPVSGEFVDYGVILEDEGIVTMMMDQRKMRCYMLTTPSFYFVDYNLQTKKIDYVSNIDKHSSVCRSLGLDSFGNVYGSFEPCQVFKYEPNEQKISFLETNFASISNSNEEWSSPNKKGANRVGRKLWRTIEFDSINQVFYGIHASDSTLFEFDPCTYRFSTVGKMQPWKNGQIYPTLTFAKHQQTYYYCPANGRFDYRLSEEIESTSALMSFDCTTKEIKQHGLIYGPQGEQVYGSASAICTKDNKLYLLAAVSTDKPESQLTFQGNEFTLSLVEIDLLSL